MIERHGIGSGGAHDEQNDKHWQDSRHVSSLTARYDRMAAAASTRHHVRRGGAG